MKKWPDNSAEEVSIKKGGAYARSEAEKFFG
jgi:hypothetical protein